MNARIVVGQGSCGLAAGAGAVYTALESKLTADVNASLGITGCVGICYLEPIVDVYAPNGELHRCVQVKPEHAEIIVKAVAENNYELLSPIVISEDDAQFRPSRPASLCVTAASSTPTRSTPTPPMTATRLWRRS